jgi:Tol biopolymer transport system component
VSPTGRRCHRRPPPSAGRLLTRCLQKDPKRRLHALADAHFELEEALAGSVSAVAPPITTPRARFGGPWIVSSIVIVVAAVALWNVLSRRTVELPPPRVLSLTSYPGVEFSPAFSPDGRQVAFSWDGEKGENEDIYVQIVGSDSPHSVTKDPARDVSPAWKPDGSQIAFARLEAGRAAIYVASPLGGSERKLAAFSAIPDSEGGPPEARDPRLSWSPDGRWLVVSRVTSGEESGVFVIAAGDGTVHRLLARGDASDDYRMAVYSPKGDALALINASFIEVVRIGATDPPTARDAPRRLTTALGFVSGLAWTADGKDLVFGRAQFPSPSPPYLWRVPVSGDRAPQRIDLAGVGGFPAVAGSSLAFVRRGLQEDLLRLQEGQVPETLLASTANEQDASYSPKGTKIAFATDRSGEGTEIWVANTDDESSRRSVTNGTHKPEGSP